MSLTVMQIAGNRGLGGMETHVVSLSRALKARGFNVPVVCKEKGWIASELAAEFDLYTLPFRRRLDFSTSARLARLLEAVRPDVVHAHGPVAYRCVARAVRSRAPFVLSVHGLSGWRGTALDADVIVACSESTRDGIRKRVRDESRLTVIRCAIDCSRFADYRDAAPTFREEFGLGDRPVVTCVRRLVPAKGQHILLEAAKLVAAEVPEARFVIVGGRSAGYERRLRRMRARLGLQDAVVFTGQRRDIPRILAGTDILVQPSIEEPLGLSAIEGMAFGLPVIASRVGGIPEVVTDGVTGLLVPPGNADELADALLRLISDRELRLRMGESGRERALSEFNLDAMVDRLVSVYEEVLAAHSAP
jgi:glycosyltransferase involved in cell wall biosynthesis